MTTGKGIVGVRIYCSGLTSELQIFVVAKNTKYFHYTL